MRTFLTDPTTADAIAASLPRHLDARVQGPADAVVAGLSTLTGLEPETLAYCTGAATPPPSQCRAGVVLCEPGNADRIEAGTRIVCEDAREAFLRYLAAVVDRGGIDYAASLARATTLKPGMARVHADAVVGASVILGEGAVIGPRAVIHDGVAIGARTVIRAGAVVGEEGIALHRTGQGEALSQPHVGMVLVGPDCEIGANAVVCRAMLGATRMGARVIAGNLCNIGHGAQIGEGSWMSAGCMIGGHAEIGQQVTIGMGAVVRDNIVIGSQASIGMGSVVTKPVAVGVSMFGVPALPTRSRLKTGPVR